MIDLDQLAELLTRLGCPAARAREMAEQLDKRAHQLAEAKGKTHEEALTHLVKLMAGGWAAQARSGNPGAEGTAGPPL